MPNYNISKEAGKGLEIERRNSLARHLIHQPPSRQAMFLDKMKSSALREDLKNRMREQLAIEISLMDANQRNLRLTNLDQHCRKTRNREFFQDILNRVRQQLEQEPAHG